MPETTPAHGLSLAPFRALRYTADSARLGNLLCPPYDVISAIERSTLLSLDPDNAVQIVLPVVDGGVPSGKSGADEPESNTGYDRAAATLARWERDGTLAVDQAPSLYVYEMSTAATNTEPPSVTRGLVGAVELRDPRDGVILPHENTMAGPVADRLALMEATQANVEPIYLVYDGGGAASRVVADVKAPWTDHDSASTDPSDPYADFVVSATTPDGTVHRLWAITDTATLSDIADDLAHRNALIADGHHRYATYRQLAQRRRQRDGPGPWDRGLALLVDSSIYGPQVHAIHRVIPNLDLDRAVQLAAADFEVQPITDPDQALAQHVGDRAAGAAGFAVVLTDGRRHFAVSSPRTGLVESARREYEPSALMELDVSILHRVLIERSWDLADTERTVQYAHSRADALSMAAAASGTAVLLRPTPASAVAAVAAVGARMPRKSTLFTPKPASGLVMRRFADEPISGPQVW